jgi:hypothetical protein
MSNQRAAAPLPAYRFNLGELFDRAGRLRPLELQAGAVCDG